MELISLYPEYYRESPQMCAMQRAFGRHTDIMWALLESLKRQLFIPTATWGLEAWENEFEIPTDLTSPLEERRSRITAKMRGQATTTTEAVRGLAESFLKTPVTVSEYPREYRYELATPEIKGEPLQVRGLLRSLDELSPAHIICGFAPWYNTWGMVSHLKWGEYAPITWGEMRVK